MMPLDHSGEARATYRHPSDPGLETHSLPSGRSGGRVVSRRDGFGGRDLQHTPLRTRC